MSARRRTRAELRDLRRRVDRTREDLRRELDGIRTETLGPDAGEYRYHRAYGAFEVVVEHAIARLTDPPALGSGSVCICPEPDAGEKVCLRCSGWLREKAS